MNIKKVLTKNGLVIYERRTPITIRLDRKETEDKLHRRVNWSRLDDFCEVVHMEISNKCNLDCSGCYVKSKEGIELSTKEWEKIIENVANSGVFQCTFGGGEPFLRPDIFTLAKHVRDCGMNLAVTSNGTVLPSTRKLRMFNMINISWHNDLEPVAKALKVLKNVEVKRGINYVFKNSTKNFLHSVRELANAFSAEILFLTYKAVEGSTGEVILPKDVFAAAKETAEMGFKVAVDGLTMKDKKEDYCLQRKRFCDIDNLGNVLPCSFIREGVGNILEEDFRKIWKERGPQVECPYEC